jgi:hypothetical protein
MRYRVKYKILPAGTGPDDYEPADLDNGETIVELPAPDGGYLPAMPTFNKAVAAQLADGAEPIIPPGGIEILGD